MKKFFGERPTTKEIFPVELGIIKRQSIKPIDARAETDPERMDDAFELYINDTYMKFQGRGRQRGTCATAWC